MATILSAVPCHPHSAPEWPLTQFLNGPTLSSWVALHSAPEWPHTQLLNGPTLSSWVAPHSAPEWPLTQLLNGPTLSSWMAPHSAPEWPHIQFLSGPSLSSWMAPPDCLSVNVTSHVHPVNNVKSLCFSLHWILFTATQHTARHNCCPTFLLTARKGTICLNWIQTNQSTMHTYSKLVSTDIQ